MDALVRDLGYATRGLRKNPGFTLVATFTIAPGIGTCTVIFSVVNAVLLRPLPYADGQRLVLVWGELRTRHVNDWPFSPPDFRDLPRQTTSSFDGLPAVNAAFRMTLSEPTAEPEQIRVAAATPNLFRLLGARVIAGRDFVEDDALLPPRANEPDSDARCPGRAVRYVEEASRGSRGSWRTTWPDDPSNTLASRTLRAGPRPVGMWVVAQQGGRR
jgi:hypothetical protein